MPIFVVLCICGNDVTYFGCQEVIESVFLLFLNFVLVYYCSADYSFLVVSRLGNSSSLPRKLQFPAEGTPVSQAGNWNPLASNYLVSFNASSRLMPNASATPLP